MNTFSPLPKLVFDDAIALDTANHVFNMHADATNATILFFFLVREFTTSWFFHWLQNPDAFRCESLKARVLSQRTARRKLIRFTVNDALIMPFAFPGSTQTANATEDVGDQHVLERVLLLFAAIVQLLLIGVTWPIYRSFCSIMEKKRVAWGAVASDAGRSSGASPLFS